MEPFIICAAVYAAVAVCVGLWLSYSKARYGCYSSAEDRNWRVYGWPLILAMLVLVGPFVLAEELGDSARIKRRQSALDQLTPKEPEG